jgi:hypothetical protein
MKKLLLILLCLPLLFTTCKKEDEEPTNTNNNNNSGPKTHVPNNQFEQHLIDEGYDDVLDDYVLTANINNIGGLDIDNMNITDLTGIEDFIALTTLYCSDNGLTSLDLSQNTALVYLYCYNNLLTSLDLSSNTDLEWAGLYNNNLTSLDLRNGLSTNYNMSIDVRQNQNLYCIESNLEPSLALTVWAGNISGGIEPWMYFSESDCP